MRVLCLGGYKLLTIITFVRHGNTDYNAEQRMQGHMDVPLNETGKKQAIKVALRLAEEQWDMIVSSDLSRARATALEISRATRITNIEFDPRLREIDKGQLSGTTEEERIKRWGLDWRNLDLGGESTEELRERGLEVVQDIATRHAGKKIIVVSHGALLRRILITLMQDEDLPLVENTSVSTIRNKEGNWELLLYNCTRHLKGVDYDASGIYGDEAVQGPISLPHSAERWDRNSQ